MKKKSDLNSGKKKFPKNRRPGVKQLDDDDGKDDDGDHSETEGFLDVGGEESD